MDSRSNSTDTVSIVQESRDVTSPLLKFAEVEPGESRRQLSDSEEGYRLVAKSLANEITKIVADEQKGVAVARQFVQSHQKINELFNSILGDVLANLSRLEQVRERRERYSSDWWDQALITLREGFAKDRKDAFNKWIRIYAQTLVDWELDASASLVKLDFSFAPEQLPYILLIRHGDASIQKKEYEPALRMLN
jgi:hypothetical protein